LGGEGDFIVFLYQNEKLRLVLIGLDTEKSKSTEKYRDTTVIIIRGSGLYFEATSLPLKQRLSKVL